MKTTFYFLFLLSFISCNSINSEQTKTADSIPKKAISKHANSLLEDPMINSLSIGISYNGQHYIAHFGELDKDQNNKPTDKTIYEIASVTKTLLGILISQAELEGKLSLDDDVRKYLDDDYNNLQYKGKPILIRHLLTHTSSLPARKPGIGELFADINAQLPYKIQEVENNYSKEQFFKDLNEIELNIMPGTSFNYSGPSTELATYIIEKIYDQPFDVLIAEKIGNQIQIKDTRVHLNEEQLARIANGYGMDGNKTIHKESKLWGGSGASKSTAADLMNYMNFLLNKNNKAAANTFKTLYDAEVIYGDENNKIGYFWILNEDANFGKSISHHGGAFGMQNWLHIFPEANLGLSIITNQSGMETSGKLDGLKEEILNELRKSLNK